jgi:septal ring factor EnvC (AmiA/AmiB activator)
MTTEMSRSLKELHDRLLDEKPEGAVHETDGCPFCTAMEESADDMTYTEDELKAKVDEAVQAAIQERDAKIADLSAAQQTSETAKAVADAIAAKDTELADLRGELDKAVLEAANAKAERDGVVAWLEGEKAAGEQREAAAARKDTRLSKLKEVAQFPDAYLEQNADRFAAMSDEEFESRCAEYAALSGKSTNGEIPSTVPGLKAGLEGPGTSRGSAVKELLALSRDRGLVDMSNL